MSRRPPRRLHYASYALVWQLPVGDRYGGLMPYVESLKLKNIPPGFGEAQLLLHLSCETEQKRQEFEAILKEKSLKLRTEAVVKFWSETYGCRYSANWTVVELPSRDPIEVAKFLRRISHHLDLPWPTSIKFTPTYEVRIKDDKGHRWVDEGWWLNQETAKADEAIRTLEWAAAAEKASRS